MKMPSLDVQSVIRKVAPKESAFSRIIDVTRLRKMSVREVPSLSTEGL
jgi:hypothetical protein